METSPPDAPPARRRLPVWPVALGLVVAVFATWITVASVNQRDPAEVVEDYLTAVAEKDLDAALALVSPYGYGIPFGDPAVFMTREAISDDWWVVSTEEVEREYSSSARVRAVIAGPGGTAQGEFSVDKHNDEWLMSDPFVEVRFPPSPLSYLQVNDKIVPRRHTLQTAHETYTLFPGPYRFYQSMPKVVTAQKTPLVAAFPPPPADRDEKVVLPSKLTAGETVVARAQRAVRNRIDDCATFTTPAPNGDCPFATDGEVDTADGRRVTDLHTLKWTVESYPTVTLTDDRLDEFVPGFAVSAAKPGSVTLTGSGVDTEGTSVTFTVACDIVMDGVVATSTADGDVELMVSSKGRDPTVAFNTCRRNA